VVLGFSWTVVIWGITLVAISAGGLRGFIRTGRVHIGRTHVALVLVLLGTHSNATRSGAEDVLANPLVVETMLRGALDLLAFVLVAPVVGRSFRVVDPTRRMLGLGALTVYVAVAGASVIYSVAALPTAGKVFELGVALTVVWALVVESRQGPRLREAIDLIMSLEIALLVVAVVGFVAVPSMFAEMQNRPGFFLPTTMVAPYAHSNGLSATGALVAVYAFAQLLRAPAERSTWRWSLVGVVGTVAMVLSSGRQGLVIWAVATAILLWRRRPRWLVVFAPVGVVLALTQWSAIWASIWEVAARNQQAGTLATWSGRLTYWDAALQSWFEHPWTGFGFGVGGRFVALRGIGEDSISSLHSGYMEALVGLGLMGAIPLAIAIVRATRWSVPHMALEDDAPYAILIIPLLLHSLVSLGFAGWLTADFVIFGILCALADIYLRDRREARLGRGARREPLVRSDGVGSGR
jgi:O-antigen ligase